MNIRASSFFLTTAVILTTAGSGRGDPEVAPFAGVEALRETSGERRAWFEEARFGMFIHWGLYSAAGGYWPPDPGTGRKFEQHYAEWIKAWAKVPEPDYGRALKPLFQPEAGCMREWAALARDAGMKYAVLTTKHHEGYTLFNSKAPWSLANDLTGGTNISPPGRDMIAEYAAAFRAAGVVPGFYYSLIDWQHPAGEAYKPYLFQHLDELASNYGEIGLLWVDFSSANTQGSHWNTRAILENWHRKQPRAIYNNRFWDGLENDCGDFFTPEKYVPPAGHPGRVFEVCHTMNESFGFSYHDRKWKSAREVAELLVDIVSKGGNLLLNIGPDRHGRVPEPSAKALREVGAWLNAHGESIYGTGPSPFVRTPFAGRCTVAARDGRHLLYCHLFAWPESGILRLDGLLTPVRSARLLGGGAGEVAVASEGGVVLRLQSGAPEGLLPVVAVELAAAPEVEDIPYPRQAPDRSVTLRAGDAVIQGAAGKTVARLEDNHIGWWSSMDDSLWFPFLMDQPHQTVHTGGTAEQQPGAFEVVLDHACANGAGGELEIRLLDQILKVVIEPTGGWNEFHSKAVGRVTIGQAGLLSVHVRPLAIRGQGLVNLRSVILRPAKP
ncbi:MAG: alpha-L-fucosidase [Akkermansiaceae bacterium]|jgi:alpha-L-fucosidase|nr:alpha-L-fucosidase [Akkermansiaceae bacterium]